MCCTRSCSVPGRPTADFGWVEKAPFVRKWCSCYPPREFCIETHVPGATSFDRGLIHSDHLTLTDRGQLGVIDRLEQRPGSYVMLKHAGEVIKLKDSQAIRCPPAPCGDSGGCYV
jgi:hypothetical protein